MQESVVIKKELRAFRPTQTYRSSTTTTAELYSFPMFEVTSEAEYLNLWSLLP